MLLYIKEVVEIKAELAFDFVKANQDQRSTSQRRKDLNSTWQETELYTQTPPIAEGRQTRNIMGWKGSMPGHWLLALMRRAEE